MLSTYDYVMIKKELKKELTYSSPGRKKEIYTVIAEINSILKDKGFYVVK